MLPDQLMLKYKKYVDHAHDGMCNKVINCDDFGSNWPSGFGEEA
jgi:hypothetical protein